MLLLSEANSAYLKQKKGPPTAGGTKLAGTQSNTPQLINTPNRSLDFSTKAATFFGNSSSGVQGSAYQFKNQPVKASQAGHKKNAMSLLDYQQLSSSFLDQNLSSLMAPPQPGLGQ